MNSGTVPAGIHNDPDHNLATPTPMNQPSYVPPKIADFALWLDNLASLVAANPTDYGLVTGDATIISGANTSFQGAYAISSNPSTRTSGAVANTNAARLAATGTVRPYCQQISKNMGVSDSLKLGIGLNLPNNAPVPVPPITDVPQLIQLPSAAGVTVWGYKQGGSSSGKAKPFGAAGLEIWRNVGTVAATDPAQCSLMATVTKSPQQFSNDPAVPGKVMTFFARWTTLSGPAGQAQKGPWSLPYVLVAQ